MMTLFSFFFSLDSGLKNLHHATSVAEFTRSPVYEENFAMRVSNPACDDLKVRCVQH